MTNPTLDYEKIVQLADALNAYVKQLSLCAGVHDFTGVRTNFGWTVTLFEALEYEVKQ
jgi:hypothetical protein